MPSHFVPSALRPGPSPVGSPVKLLKATQGNVSHARCARRTRTKVYPLLRRYQLDPESFRAPE